MRLRAYRERGNNLFKYCIRGIITGWRRGHPLSGNTCEAHSELGDLLSSAKPTEPIGNELN